MRKLYAFLLFYIIHAACLSQDNTLQVTLRYYDKIAKKANILQDKITKQNTDLFYDFLRRYTTADSSPFILRWDTNF